MMVEPEHPELSIRRQCELLELSPSTFYYRPRRESVFNERLMGMIDREHLRAPFLGVGQMTRVLNRLLEPEGIPVNPKRVRRLMRLMGLEAIYPKPRTSVKHPGHAVYPYLLKGLVVDRPDQVWCTDITYIPMRRGWLYLVAIMDWFSRFVLAWELSNTLDAQFCVAALERALASGTPGIFNSDQGSQFTSRAFTGVLEAAAVRISMDGRGRVYDNIFIERLWRTVKYEHVYLHEYPAVPDAVRGIGSYLAYYNHERPHSSLDGRTPAEVYGHPAPSAGTNGIGQEGVAARSAASPLALRARDEAAATEGAFHSNSPEIAPS